MPKPPRRPPVPAGISRIVPAKPTAPSTPARRFAAQPGNVLDLGAARERLRPTAIDGRQALVLTLVEQLSALVRGTITAERAGAVRRAASKALDLMEQVESGSADVSDAQRAFRDVEALLSRPR